MRWLIAAALAAALVCAWLTFPYRVSRYQGDGTITDSGFWSHPRYRVRLPPMDLQTDRTRTYRLRGTPSVPLSLKLEVVGPRPLGHEGFDTLAAMETRVSVAMSDEHGKLTASAAGPLRNWVLTRGDGYAAYWHPDVRDFRLRKGTSYTLTISAADGSPAPLLTLMPTLEGGGNELP
jgi:hypothetical protein